MARSAPLTKAAVDTLHRVFPFLAAPPALRFKFGIDQQLLLSTDGGWNWHRAPAIDPGYKSLRLWRQGRATYLQLEYADRTLAFLSTDGATWQTGRAASHD